MVWQVDVKICSAVITSYSQTFQETRAEMLVFIFNEPTLSLNKA